METPKMGTDDNGNILWTWQMPNPFALTSHGEVILGCAECSYLGFVQHQCDSECAPHEIVQAPIPLNVPHWTH